MPRGASSWASERASPTTPNLLAQYAVHVAEPLSPPAEAMNVSDPGEVRVCAAARATRKLPVRLVSMIRSHCSRETSSMAAHSAIPAQCTTSVSGAGAFYGHYLVVLSPQMADFNEMAKLIIMVVLGGLGTVLGPLIGAAPVQILTTYLQKYGEWDLVIFALEVIVLMRTYVGGIATLVYAALARYGRKRAIRGVG